MYFPPRKSQSGFSLIELMIVVAIIAVLSAVAVPQYQNYLTRARWTVNFNQLEAMKLSIAECLQQSGGLASECNTAAKLGLTALPTLLHSSAAVELANVGETSVVTTITGNAAAGNCKVTVTGTLDTEQLTWSYAAIANGAVDACTKQLTGV